MHFSKDSTPRDIFEELDNTPEKTNKVNRSIEYSRFTNPFLFSDLEIHNDVSEELSQNSQSIGSMLVSNLGNKLTTSLLGIAKSFFKLQVDSKVVDELIANKVFKDKSELDVQLSQVEKKAVKELATMALRSKFTHAIQLSEVTGDALIKIPKDGENAKVWDLRSYVLDRSLDGTLHKICIKEKIRFRELSEKNQKIVQAGGMRPNETEEEELDIYTLLKLKGNRWHLTQSVDDAMLVSTGSWSKDLFPYLPLPWKLRDGENYGRGHVEDNAGDFSELQRVSDSLSKITAIMSRVILLVNPNAMSSPQDLNAANDGDAVAGVESDFMLLTYAEKLREVEFLTKRQQSIEQRLSRAFLNFEARDSERTTAEEVRITANQLEGNLGGVFSSFSEIFQQPLARILLDRIDFKLDKTIDPVIVTGLDSLSRNAELEAVNQFGQAAVQLASLPPEISVRIKIDAFFNKIAAGLGLDPKELVRTDAEVAEIQNQQRQQEQEDMKAQEAAKAASGVVQNAAQQQAQQ